MYIHLVRHAHAGSRSDWPGEDEDRPLSDKGRAQAVAIGRDLSRTLADAGGGASTDAVGTVELWSSPYMRCVETLAPLSQQIGLPIRRVDLLAEGSWGTDALNALLRAAEDGTTVVAASHGDVIPEIVRAVVGRGADLDGPAMPRKGGRYLLEVVDGAVTRVTYVERPAVPET